MKKLIALMLVFSFVFALASCDGRQSPEETETTEQYVLPTPVVNADISLPYTSAAGFDPYTTKSSLNRDLIPVIYEGLFISTDNGEGIPLLAISSKNEGKKVTVKLLQGARFSDGTEILSSHVKSSFEKAKNSAYYSAALKNIASVTLADNYNIIFNLTNPDAQCVNVLNFPIVKSNGKAVIGSGKYYVAELKDATYLQVNEHHREYKSSWNEQIALYDMAGITSPLYPFKANEISVYKNDLSTEEYVNLSSKTISVGTDNLVYAGVNSQWAGTVTSIDWVRQAINIGIDRTTICAASFLGQGTPTVTPFKSQLKALEGIELVGEKGNLERAIGILERNGYNKTNSEGIRTNGSASLRVDILVCIENPYKLTVAESFKAELEKLGFGVTINKKKTTEEFVAALKEGHYSFYIGETKLTPNCDMSAFFSKSGKLNYGIDEEFFSEYSSYKKGEASTTQFVESFSTEIPFLPLFYRKAVVSVNPNISGIDDSKSLYSSVSDWKKQQAD